MDGLGIKRRWIWPSLQAFFNTKHRLHGLIRVGFATLILLVLGSAYSPDRTHLRLQGKADHPARKARQCCASFAAIAPMERGRPAPGLLAHVLVSKYADHLPLYRLSQMFAGKGFDLDLSTMSDLVGHSTAPLEPLADAIGRIERQGAAFFADDTPVTMLAPGNKKTRPARVWAYVRDERAWSGRSQRRASYQFTVGRKGGTSRLPPVGIQGLGPCGWVFRVRRAVR